MRQKKILFFAEAVTLAHVCRLYTLAKALLNAGYSIYFATDARMRRIFDFSCFSFMPIKSIPGEDFLERIETGKRLYRYNELEQYAEEELSVIDQVEPDLIVGDLRVSLAVTSRVAGVPYWLVTNAYWSPFSTDTTLPVPEIRNLPLTLIPGIAPLGKLIQPLMLAFHLGPINQLADRYRVERFRNFPESFTFADRTFYADIPGIAPCSKLPANHSYLGQIKWSADAPLPDNFTDTTGKRKRIFINMGSSGPAKLLERIISAFPEDEYHLTVATAGRTNPQCSRKNTCWADFVPAEEISKQSDLVICNGGSPSTYLALSNGVPVIGIPSNLDQLLNMRNVCRREAGSMIRASRFSVQALKTEADRILNNEIFGKAAGKLAREFAEYNAPETFRSAVRNFLEFQNCEMVVERLAG